MPRPVVILDAYGRPARLETEPVADPEIWGEWRSAPGRPTTGLQPDGIKAIFREADDGFPQRQVELLEDLILKDGRIPGNIVTRTTTPAKLAWTLQPASEDAADKRVLDWLRPKLEALSLRDAFARLHRATAFGYAAEQILWATDGSDVDVVGLQNWPTRHLLPDATGHIRKISSVTNPAGGEMPPARFVVHEAGLLATEPVAAGFGRPLSWFWYFKNFGMKWWLQYVESYSQPLRWANFPKAAKPEEKAEAWGMLTGLGQQAAAMLPEGFTLQLHDQAHKGGPDLYERLQAACDREISILILGQTLTSSVGDTGSYAAARVHDSVRWDLVEWDAMALADTIRRDLLTPWVRFRWGRDADVPRFAFRTEEPEDLQAAANTVKTLVVDTGLPIGTDYLYDRFGIPRPGKGDEVLAGPPERAQETGGAARIGAPFHARDEAPDPGKARRPGATLLADLMTS